MILLRMKCDNHDLVFSAETDSDKTSTDLTWNRRCLAEFERIYFTTRRNATRSPGGTPVFGGRSVISTHATPLFFRTFSTTPTSASSETASSDTSEQARTFDEGSFVRPSTPVAGRMRTKRVQAMLHACTLFLDDTTDTSPSSADVTH